MVMGDKHVIDFRQFIYGVFIFVRNGLGPSERGPAPPVLNTGSVIIEKLLVCSKTVE